jgi:hypothetical protein
MRFIVNIIILLLTVFVMIPTRRIQGWQRKRPKAAADIDVLKMVIEATGSRVNVSSMMVINDDDEATNTAPERS